MILLTHKQHGGKITHTDWFQSPDCRSYDMISANRVKGRQREAVRSSGLEGSDYASGYFHTVVMIM